MSCTKPISIFFKKLFKYENPRSTLDVLAGNNKTISTNLDNEGY